MGNREMGRLADYLARLALWNERIRLVGSAATSELVAHAAESLYLAKVLDLGEQKLWDIGSGGGFPGLALQLAFPTLNTTLVESNSRKAAFLQDICRATGLGAVRCQRMEELSADAEIVTSRALERMGEGAARFAHLLKPGGKLAVWVTQAMAEEWVGRGGPWRWLDPKLIPESRERVILVGERA